MLYNYSAQVTKRWLKLFSYTRALLITGFLVVSGSLLVLPLAAEYVTNQFVLPEETGRVNYMAVLGLFLIISAFMMFTSTLIIHAAGLRPKSSSPGK